LSISITLLDGRGARDILTPASGRRTIAPVRVLRRFTWVLLPASLVVGLAALLRMAGPGPAGPDDLTGVIRLPKPVTSTLLALFALAGLVFLVGLVRRARSLRPEADALGAEDVPPPAWMRTVTQILSLVNFVILAYLIWRGVIPLADLLALGQGLGSAIAPAPQDAPVVAPPLVTWTYGVLALVAGLGVLALALWVAFSDRLAEWWERTAPDPHAPRPLGAVDESLEDLRAEPDARRAIIRCYGRFERVAAGSGVERKAWFTPLEFMREALARLPIARGAVPTLTELFELARFSRRTLGPAERDRALDALGEITTAIEKRRADAAAR